MKKINGVIVVEGLHDKNLIESFYEVDFVLTNGFDINEKEIDYLNHLPESVDIILLTDPDESGDKIRKKLESKLYRFENENVDIKNCNKHNKHGVAECNKNEIQIVLDKYVNNNDFAAISADMLENLGILNSINSKKLIDLISRSFNLGCLTKNNILKRLNLMNIKLSEIERTILENGN